MISLQNMEKVERIRRKTGNALSSHCFASMFLWQTAYAEKLEMTDDMYVVKMEVIGNNEWFFPCGEESAIHKFISSHIEEKDFVLSYLREEDKEYLEKEFPDVFTFERDENSDEYILDAESMSAMAGGKYKNLRREMKLFEQHNYRIDDITEDNIGIVDKMYRQLMEDGLMQKLNYGSDFARDNVIAYWKELGMFGIIVYVDDEPVGALLGFEIDEETVDACMEFRIGEQTGLATFLEKNFFMRSGYQYMNIEEDLGIEGLRKRKNSLCPIRKNIIYRAYIV